MSAIKRSTTKECPAPAVLSAAEVVEILLEDVDELIASIFDKHPEVEYLHARNAEACCFICKIERV